LVGVGFFASEGNVRLDVAGERIQLSIGGELVLGTLAIAQNRLRGFLIIPEIGLGDFASSDFKSSRL